MSLENYILDHIEGRREGYLIKKMLLSLSHAYKSGVLLRHAAYDRNWIKVKKTKPLVVSIGNIVSGGTGKTPFVKKLADELLKFTEVAILSRGFRSKMEKSGKVFNISSGDGAVFSPDLCGDEPYMLASLLKDVDVWVGKDRTLSAELAFQNGAKVVLLDDGMQYRSLHRDIEIVMIDGKDPFGKGHFLPYGFLREDPRRLKGAGLVVLNHIQDRDHFEKAKSEIMPYTNSPMIGAQMQIKEKEKWAGKKVGIFCGIGKPMHFIDGIKESAEVVESLITLDHGTILPQRLAAFACGCKQKGAEMLLCTQKDFVKLPLELQLDLPVVVVEAEIKIAFDEIHWYELIEKIKEKTHISA